jgi:hypothetical protein
MLLIFVISANFKLEQKEKRKEKLYSDAKSRSSLVLDSEGVRNWQQWFLPSPCLDLYPFVSAFYPSYSLF